MRYCKGCGHPLKPGAHFCNECGMPVEGNITEAKNRQSRNQEKDGSNKSMTKRQKTYLLTGIVALIVLLALYKVGDYYFSPEYTISRFEDALTEKNAKKLAKSLTSDHQKLKINEQSVQSLLAYYKKYPNQVNQTVQSLKRQAINNKTDYSILNGEVPGMIHLEKDGKSFIFDRYQLKVEPAYISISTNYENTVLYVDEEKVGTTSEPDGEKTVGPFVPGIHKIKAKLKTSFVDLMKTKTIIADNTDSTKVTLQLDGEDIYVDLDMGDESIDVSGKLYINGKDVHVDPFKQQTFGPVLTDGSMTAMVEAELPWGKMKSTNQTIDSNNLQVNLGSDTAFQKTIMNTVVQYNKEWLEAFTSGDSSKFTAATDDLRAMLHEDIELAKSANIYYKAKYIGTTFNTDSIKLYTNEGKFYSDVIMHEHMQSASYYADEMPELKENKYAFLLTLMYDTSLNKWVVYSSRNSYMNDGGDTKTIKEDVPKVYTTTWNKNVEVGSQESSNVPTAISELIDAYTGALVDAINEHDFNQVAPYLEKGSELYNMQKKLVEKLNKKGITEEKISCNIRSYSIEGNTATIATNERVKINYANGTSETKEYNWVYEAVKADSGFQLTTIKEK